jgi:membrane fusion protein (multidrug efflux system)
MAALLGCDRAESGRGAQGPPPPVVEVVTVATGPLRDALALVGQLEADESVMLRPETSGVIASVEFAEGDQVKGGTVLFRLRDDEQRARLAEAEAQLTLAGQSHDRAAALAGERILARHELDRMIAERNAARARADLAKVELERTQIRAPFDGLLGRRLVSPGERVSNETPLVQLDAIARLKLIFTVPERIIAVLRPGLPLTLAVAPYPDRRFSGEVFFVAPTVDPANRQMLAKAWVPNTTGELRPGLFTTMELEVAKRDDAIAIPEAAIVYDAQGDFVWRLNAENVAERAPVKLGIRREGRVEVIAGLAAGDRVVSAGTNKVIPGHAVQVADAVPIPGTPPADGHGG